MRLCSASGSASRARTGHGRMRTPRRSTRQPCRAAEPRSRRQRATFLANAMLPGATCTPTSSRGANPHAILSSASRALVQDPTSAYPQPLTFSTAPRAARATSTVRAARKRANVWYYLHASHPARQRAELWVGVYTYFLNFVDQHVSRVARAHYFIQHDLDALGAWRGTGVGMGVCLQQGTSGGSFRWRRLHRRVERTVHEEPCRLRVLPSLWHTWPVL